MVGKAVDVIEKKIMAIEEELEGIEKVCIIIMEFSPSAIAYRMSRFFTSSYRMNNVWAFLCLGVYMSFNFP